MRTSESVVPLFWNDFEAKIEPHFERFLIFFHSDDPAYKGMLQSRAYIKSLPSRHLKQQAYYAALTVIADNEKESDERLIPFIADRIYRHYKKYRTENCSQVRIFVNDILDGHFNG